LPDGAQSAPPQRGGSSLLPSGKRDACPTSQTGKRDACPTWFPAPLRGTSGLLLAPALFLLAAAAAPAAGPAHTPLRFRAAPPAAVELDANREVGKVTVKDKTAIPTAVLAQPVGPDFTLAFWLRAESPGLLSRPGAWDNDAPMTALVLLSAGNAGRIILRLPQNRLQVAASAGAGSGWPQFASTSLIEPGRWHHVALTFSDGVARLFLDGALDATSESLPRLGGLDTVMLGRSGGTRHLDGTLLAPRFWAAPLAPAGIRALAAARPAAAGAAPAASAVSASAAGAAPSTAATVAGAAPAAAGTAAAASPSTAAATATAAAAAAAAGLSADAGVSFARYPVMRVADGELHPLIDQLDFSATVVRWRGKQAADLLVRGVVPSYFGGRTAYFQQKGGDHRGLPFYDEGATLRGLPGIGFQSVVFAGGREELFAGGAGTPHGAHNLVSYAKDKTAAGLVFDDARAVTIGGRSFEAAFGPARRVGGWHVGDLDADGTPDLLVSALKAGTGDYWPDGEGMWGGVERKNSGKGRGYDVRGEWLGDTRTSVLYWAKGIGGGATAAGTAGSATTTAPASAAAAAPSDIAAAAASSSSSAATTTAAAATAAASTAAASTAPASSAAAAPLTFAAPKPVWFRHAGFAAQWRAGETERALACVRLEGRPVILETGSVDRILALPFAVRDGELVIEDALPLLENNAALRETYFTHRISVLDEKPDGTLRLLLDGNPGRLVVLEGRRIGAFRELGSLLMAGGPLAVDALATPVRLDWDADGLPDLIVGDSSGWLTLWRGTADPAVYHAGVFMTAAGRPVHHQAGPGGSIQGPNEKRWGYLQPTAGDWDGDGLPEIITNDIHGILTLYKRAAAAAAATPAAAVGPPAAALAAPAVFTKDGRPHPVAWRSRPAIIPAAANYAGAGLPALLHTDWDGHLAVALPAAAGATEIAGVEKLRYADGRPILLCGPGGSWGRVETAVADWNNDGKWDILFGTIRGNQRFYLPKTGPGATPCWLENTGSNDRPRFAPPRPFRLKNGAPIDLGVHTAAVFPTDLDADGAPDLIVGAEDGKIYRFLRSELEWE
jgi:hypothetical protein